MDEVQHLLGRIEDKIDGITKRIDEQQQGLYGAGGIEPRLRTVETDVAVVKTRAGMISTGISTGIAVLSWVLSWMFKGGK